MDITRDASGLSWEIYLWNSGFKTKASGVTPNQGMTKKLTPIVLIWCVLTVSVATSPTNGHQSSQIKEWWWFWHNHHCSPCERAITTFYYSYLPAKWAERNYFSNQTSHTNEICHWSRLSQILTKWTAALGNSHDLKILKPYHNSIAGFSLSPKLILGFVSYTHYFCSETLLLSKEVTSFEVLSCSITEKWKKDQCEK